MGALERDLVIAGASNQLGASLAPKAAQAGWHVTGISRSGRPDHWPGAWLQQDLKQDTSWPTPDVWIHAAPLDGVPAQAFQARSLIVFSSTSAVTKQASPDPVERRLATFLSDAEEQLRQRAKQADCQLHILRPTMIWGAGRDENVTLMRRWLLKRRLLPLVTGAQGLRQPVHVQDLVAAALVLAQGAYRSADWVLPGAEPLPYLEFVRRIRGSVNGFSLLLPLPMWVWRAGLMLAPRARRSQVHALLQRMRQNLDFSVDDWGKLNLKPRGFQPKREDFDE